MKRTIKNGLSLNLPEFDPEYNRNEYHTTWILDLTQKEDLLLVDKYTDQTDFGGKYQS